VIAVSENTERIEPVERFGFITVVEVPELGFAGGMLVVSPQGRPIEFHCTPPVAENRTQKILYGQTYRGFLFCDQIAASIFEKSKARPQLLITDRAELLALDKIDQTPVVMLCSEEPIEHRVAGFDVGGEQVAAQIRDNVLLSSVKYACNEFTKALPLVEPFERIRLAIDEAQAVER
jgi:hypothetical protein